MNDLEIKKCYSCGKHKNTGLFHTDNSKADGKYPSCKECKNKNQIKSYRKNIKNVRAYKKNNKEKIALYHEIYQKKYYTDNKGEILKRCKEYASTVKGKEVMAHAYKKWVDENPIKAKARNTVFLAIKRGDLKRHPCGVCGDIKSHGHHADYSRPLDVIWLCSQHHKDWHKENGEGKNG